MLNGLFSKLGYVKASSVPKQTDTKDLLNSFLASINALSGLSGQRTFASFCNAYTSWVYTAIDKKAKTIAALPLKLYTYQRKSTGKCIPGMEVKTQLKNFGSLIEKRKWLKANGIQQVEIDDHPFYELMKKPNKIDVRSTLWYSIVTKLELNGFIGLYKVKAGKMPIELWSLPFTKTGNFYAIADKVQIIKGYQYRDGDVNSTFDLSEIVPIRYPDPGNPLGGYSPLQAQEYPYDLDLFLMKQQWYALKNGARPGTILTTDQQLTKEQVDELKTQIAAQFAGVAKTGKAMVLHSGLKQDEPLQMTGEDLLVKEIVDYARDKILTGLSTTPSKIGLGKYETRAALEVVNESYLLEAIKPTNMFITEALDAYLLSDYDSRLVCDFELPQPNERELDLAERKQNLETMLHTINEERALINEEPVEWGDKPWASFGLVQIGAGSVGPNARGNNNSQSDNNQDDNQDENNPPKALYQQKTMSKEYWTKERLDIEWKTFAKKSERYEEVFSRVVSEYFDNQLGEILQKLNSEGSKIKSNIAGWNLQKVKSWISEHKSKFNDINIDKKEAAKQLREIAKPVYMMIMQEFGQSRMNQLAHVKSWATPGKLYTVSTKDYSFTWNSNDPRAKKYLGDRLDEFSKEITGTTFEDVDKVLRAGFSEGEPLPNIAETLRSTFANYEKYRAPLIARTETMSASNKADIEAVRQTGLDKVMKKHWLDSRDENVRESHADAGEKYADGIDMDVNFEIGEDSMEAPGNGKIAKENIQCRCTMYYSVKD